MTLQFPFLKVLKDLDQDSTQIVLVGGWVVNVYFHYLWQGQTIFPTKDIDYGIPQDAALAPLLQARLLEEEYNHKHLKLGHLRPYQVIYEGNPIDFLADELDEAAVIEQALGPNILLNLNPHYRELLEHTLVVDCDGVKVRVPHPANYILHKIYVYLSSPERRQKDLAVSYYCLSRSPDYESILTAIKERASSEVAAIISKDLPLYMKTKRGAAIQAVQRQLRAVGLDEGDTEIYEALREIVDTLS